jgi:phosphoadenosine phosphosulfate reductase
MATRIYPEIQVLFLDTGLLFPETHLFMEEIRERLKLNVRVFRASPQQAAAVRPRAGAGPGDTQRCCSTLKVSLMRRSLVGLDCWIAGLRRDQSAARRGVRVVETHQDGPIKVHPLAHWTTERVHAYMLANDLPFHPLWYKGYTSIGCEPCTRPPAEGGDLRSGRWMGLAKTECGIHTFLTSKEAARSAG